MKKLMITGGLVGFLAGVVFGLLERSGWPAILWPCVAAGVAVCLLRSEIGGIKSWQTPVELAVARSTKS